MQRFKRLLSKVCTICHCTSFAPCLTAHTSRMHISLTIATNLALANLVLHADTEPLYSKPTLLDHDVSCVRTPCKSSQDETHEFLWIHAAVFFVDNTFTAVVAM